jgi:hypothetical protein
MEDHGMLKAQEYKSGLQHVENMLTYVIKEGHHL